MSEKRLEVLEGIAKGLGLRESDFELLETEDFNLAEFVKTKTVQIREESFELALKDEGRKKQFVELYDKTVGNERYQATLKPVLNRVSRTLGVTKTELKEKKLTELVDMLDDHYKVVLDKSKGNVSEEVEKYVEELKTYKTENAELRDQVSDQKSVFEAQLAERDSKFEVYKTDFDANQYLQNKVFPKIEFANEALQKVGKRDTLRWLKERYKIGANGEISDKDGTQATRPDKQGFYKSVDEAVEDYARTEGFVKRSNGGQEPRTGDFKMMEDGKKYDTGAQSTLADLYKNL